MSLIDDDLVIVDACDSTTGWSIVEGAGTLSAVSGIRRQGSAAFRFTSSSQQISAIEKTTFNLDLTDQVLMVWMAPEGSRVVDAFQDVWLRIGSSATDWKQWRVDGLSDRDGVYGGWQRYIIDPTSTSTTSNGTLDIANIDRIRFRYDHVAKSTPSYNLDMFTRGVPRNQVDTTGLVEGTAFDFEAVNTQDESDDAGILHQSLTMGTYGLGGVFRVLGTGWFADTLKSILIRDNVRVHQVDGGQGFEITGNTVFRLGTISAGIGFDGCVLISEGTQRWFFKINSATADVRLFGCTLAIMSEFTVTLGDLIMADCVISDCSTIDFRTSTDDLDRVTFVGCGEITPNGAQLDDCSIINNVGTYAMVIDVPADIVNVTNPAFTGNNRAIKITAAGTYDFDNHSYSGNTFDVETTHSSGVVTINVNNGGDVPTTNAAGAGTIVVVNAKIVKATINDNTGSPIENARVLIEAQDGTGSLPFEDTVTITRSGSTASVSHTAHGMASADKVVIRGANEQEYNGVFVITNVTTNAYDYTVSGTPATPATGTIKATGVVIEGLTDVNGIIQNTSFNYSVDQPIIGSVRKSTTPVRFKSFLLTGTITTDGFLTEIRLIPDE